VEYFFLVSLANPNSRINFSQKRLRERRDKHEYIYIYIYMRARAWMGVRMRVEIYTKELKKQIAKSQH